MQKIYTLLVLLTVLFPLVSNAQSSPHGKDFSISCNVCHTSSGWAIDKSVYSFDHSKTAFPLIAKHADANCKSCHPTLVFAAAKSKTLCVDCHTDTHDQTLGTECSRCHTPKSWIIENVSDLHQKGRFPLLGKHATADCYQCHKSASLLRFDPLGIECSDCHRSDFEATTTPNHEQAGFQKACDECHSNKQGWKPADFRSHDLKYFPVYSGKHAGTWNSCAECHTTAGNFVRFSCTDCHQHSNQTEVNSQHAGVGGYTFNSDMCYQCHPQGTKTGGFNHDKSGFPLTGAHTTTACSSCHTNGYAGTTTVCSDCHINNYNQAANPNHVAANLPKQCATCHTTLPGWKPATFANHNQYYVIEGAHTTADCNACHKGNYTNTPNTCSGCHMSNYTQAVNPNHAAAHFSDDCASCHGQTAWKPSTYDHDNPYFPIYSGKHKGTWNTCAECHTNASDFLQFSCIDCHDHNKPDMDTKHADVGGYAYNSIACYQCHPTGQSQGSYNHNTSGFPLTAGHQNVECVKCHANGYAGTPSECSNCHMGNYNQSTNPGHVAANIPTLCSTCHTTNPGWKPATFPIHNNYFQLSGAHTTVACESCHTNNNYNNTPNACAGCHLSNYNQSTNPPHASLGFPTECGDCHTANPGWAPATFAIHNNYYPLTGAHATLACTSCHSNGSYTSAPTACVGCHQSNYNQTTNPPHATLGFPTDCGACHTTNPGWSPATFVIHNNYYPLTGAHTTTPCGSCHIGNNYNNIPSTCAGCHQSNYNQTSNPPHVALGFPNDCASCHTTNPGWSPAAFTLHNNYYMLTGAHTTVDCGSCHTGGNYTNIPNTCSGCHQNNYNQSTNPPHVALGFPNDCASCHTTTPGWSPATFSIHNNYYPLTGAHTTVECGSCHTNNNYTNIPAVCSGCHINNYNQSTNPPHVSLGIPTDCASCHSTNPGWSPAAFPIHNNYYPLTGAHTTVACESCHTNNNYTSIPNACAGCHINNYNQTTNPNHAAISIPTDCANCHTTIPGWNPATFPIHNNYYVLEGAHVNLACASCHNGNYNTTPNSCAGCHMNNYNQTTNPNHVAAQFPTECASCHTQTSWTPSTFNHDGQYFPIYSGSHLGVWNSCSECHTDPTNYTVYTCTTACHSQTTTGNQHQGVGGYTYNSNACLSCHPNGVAAGSFNHSTSPFPLTGGHANLECSACHANGYAGTSTVCADCHINNYNQSTNPNHATAGIPTDCASCHTTNPGWNPATFPIHNNYYALTGAHASGPTCADCHNGNYNTTPNACAGCHINNYNQTTNPPHVSLAIPTECATCHTTNPGWTPAAFPIHNNYYVLAGAHVNLACSSCHTNGNYTSAPNTCAGCHLPDYNQTNNPNHAAAQFPTDCETCHTQTAWIPSTFDHDGQYFPIYSGKHKNKWNTCSDCHPNPSNFTVFTCTTSCHPQNSTNNHHQGVNGYSYNSAACYQCHPTGNAGKMMNIQPLQRNN